MGCISSNDIHKPLKNNKTLGINNKKYNSTQSNNKSSVDKSKNLNIKKYKNEF